MKTLWLITARGDSKGVPGKNLKQIGGLSVIEWKIRAARAADPAAFVAVSSDSHEILEEGQRAGASYLIGRPAELATDTSSSASVIKHALESAVYGGRGEYDRVVLLEPSAPFTTGADYRRALQMMEDRDADLIVGMKDTAPHTAFIGDTRDDLSVTPIIVGFQRMARRRQDYAPQWTMNGALYVFKTEMFLRTHDVYGGARNYGLMMDKWHSIEIDTPEDLEMAEYAAAKGYVGPEGV